jgi:hypothetical protein
VLGFKYKQWAVSRRDKQPLLDFVVEGLRESGCTVLFASQPDRAPFFITYETPSGEREGVLVYAFFANAKVTKNRPEDEHRFQVKYGSDTKAILPIEQDPSRLVTTIFVGIDTQRELLVGADPALHDRTPMFISIEFKRRDIEHTLRAGWHAWERDSNRRDGEPVEVLVAAKRERLLDYIRYERAASGLSAGHRQLLAEKVLLQIPKPGAVTHALVDELGLPESALLDLIQQTGRLKMAVRGWVAEVHLEDYLNEVPGVDECVRLNAEGQPDLSVVFKGRAPILVECKNVLRARASDGAPRLDFQRTRASKADPCSRYYRRSDFSVVAACLHAVSERWEYRFAPTSALPPHAACEGRLKSALKVDATWSDDAAAVLDRVSA